MCVCARARARIARCLHVYGVVCELAVCVPAPYLSQVQSLLAGSPVSWGAQDLSDQEAGAFTGEISAAMLKDFACRYVIVGHSERRALHGESSELVAKKTIAALSAGLVPIVCVGETLAEREAGLTAGVVEQQLAPVLAAVGSRLADIVIAYEPVWAIGTGQTASPEQAQEMHAYIRKLVAEHYNNSISEDVSILYGGSVKPDNAKELFSQPDVDGGLVGGASLKSRDFTDIAKAF